MRKLVLVPVSVVIGLWLVALLSLVTDREEVPEPVIEPTRSAVRPPVQVTKQSLPGGRPRPIVNPCDLTTDDMAGMSQYQIQTNWEACREISGLSNQSPEVEAANHLREAADCLDFTRGQILDAADRSPAVAQRQVELVMDACGLSIVDYPGLSMQAKVFAVMAMNRIDTTAVEQAVDRSGLNRTLDVLIQELIREAGRIEP